MSNPMAIPYARTMTAVNVSIGAPVAQVGTIDPLGLVSMVRALLYTTNSAGAVSCASMVQNLKGVRTKQYMKGTALLELGRLICRTGDQTSQYLCFDATLESYISFP